MPPQNTPVAKLKNLGEKSAGWLNLVGIRTFADLEKAGVLLAFRAVKDRIPKINIMMLYALEGALHDIHWQAITKERREELREEMEFILGYND